VKDIQDYLEKEQVDQMLEAAIECNTRDYLMVRVLWRTGMRISELLNMKSRDIEFNNHVINITRAKGGKQRRIPLDSQTLLLLSSYISAQSIHENRPIFDITRQHANRIVKKYGKIAGLNVHPHTLRHSFAIHLVRSGVDLRRIQLLLGHSDLNITQVYLQFKDTDIKEAYDRVEF